MDRDTPALSTPESEVVSRAGVACRHADSIGFGSVRFSYGWILVATLFGTSLLIQGIALGAITLFDEFLLNALDVSRGELKFRDSIFLLSSATSCFILGKVCEWIGVRPTMALGLLALSLVMGIYSTAPSLGMIYLLHVILGFSLSTAHVVMIMIVISRWFGTADSRRGVALGITVAGASFGAVFMSQFVGWLLSILPWVEVFRILAALPLLFIPAVGLLVRPPSTDGRGWGIAKDASGAGFGATIKAVLRSPLAALLLVSIVPVFYVSACITVHTVLLLRDQGLTIQGAATGVATMFAFGLVGKLGSGFVLLRLSLRSAWQIFLSLMLAGSALLWLMPVQAPLVAIALIGLGWGGCFPYTQLRIAAVFPGPNLAPILGLFVIIESMGSAAGAWVTALLFDRTGGYSLPLAVNTALLIGAWLISLVATQHEKKVHRNHELLLQNPKNSRYLYTNKNKGSEQ